MVFGRKQFVSYALDDNKFFVMSHNSVKNLGVIRDCNLSLEEQIGLLLQNAFFIFATLEKFVNLLMKKNCKVLANSLVVSHLDYCYSLYYVYRIFYCLKHCCSSNILRQKIIAYHPCS